MVSQGHQAQKDGLCVRARSGRALGTLCMKKGNLRPCSLLSCHLIGQQTSKQILEMRNRSCQALLLGPGKLVS